MRTEQEILLATSKKKNKKTDNMPTYDYLNELELIVILYNKKHLNKFIYNEMILPFITDYINTDRIKELIRNAQEEGYELGIPNIYCHLSKLINKQEEK